MKIKLTDIWVRDRVREDMGDIRGMAQDLQDNGQITAITVRPANEEDKANPGYKGQPYVLIAGGRRLAAAAVLGWPTIEAFEREEMAELTHRVLELHENLKRKAMTFEEEVKAQQEIFRLRQAENPNITQAEVAAELGMTAANLSRGLSAAKAIEANPELAKAGSTRAVLRLAELDRHQKAQKKLREQNETGGKLVDLDSRMVTADMRDWLRHQDDASVNLFLVDYPYGMSYFKQGHKSSKAKNERRTSESIAVYDDSPEYALDLMTDTIPQIARATRLNGWMVFFGNFDSYLWMRELVSDCCVTHYDYRTLGNEAVCAGAAGSDLSCKFLVPEPIPWIWHRPNSQNNPRYPQLHAKNYHEYILVVNRGAGQLNPAAGQSNVSNVLTFDAYYGADRIHPNQKPVDLYKELVMRCSDLGDTVADPCFGSGSSLAAASSLARFIRGCEMNASLLGPAKGIVSKHMAPMGNITEEAAAERAGRAVEVAVEELESTAEVSPAQTPYRVEEKGPESVEIWRGQDKIETFNGPNALMAGRVAAAQLNRKAGVQL